MTMALHALGATGATTSIYLEIAAVVTTFLLAGRYFEARSKRRAGAALQALLELGAKDVAVLDADGAERRIPIEQLAVGDRFVVRPGEKVATDGVVEEGQLRRRPVAADRRVRAGREAARRRGRRRARSTPAGGWSCAPRASAPTRRWRRSPAWSPTRRRARRPSSASPTASPGVFVPVVIGSPSATLGFWLGGGASRRRSRSPPPSPC